MKNQQKKKIAQRGQIFIISIWIFLILSVLALSIAHQVSLSLRISTYYRDRTKGIFLAKAAIERAIIELLNDKTKEYDSLQDNWADNKDVFETIKFDVTQNDFSSISYVLGDPDNKEIYFGVIDEERKININTASKDLLVVLLDKCGISPSDEIAENILIWRGDEEDKDKRYEALGYPCKAKKFVNIAELELVKGLDVLEYQKLKNFVTVYGNGSININTSDVQTLTLLAYAIAEEMVLPSAGIDVADGLAAKIVALRNKKGYFKDQDDLLTIAAAGGLTAEEMFLLNTLTNNSSIAFVSSNFLIQVTSYCGKIKKTISVVYNRQNKKILNYHES